MSRQQIISRVAALMERHSDPQDLSKISAIGIASRHDEDALLQLWDTLEAIEELAA